MVWEKFKAKKYFQKQTFTTYLRLTQVLIRLTLREKTNTTGKVYFLFASIYKFFFSAGRLGTRLSFDEV